MSESRHCPHCGVELAADAPEGLCPRCLMQAGLGSQASGGPGPPPANPGGQQEGASDRDCLQPGYRQVVAGYILYGSSTMLVYTTGAGVHGFTLDPTIGEFLLSHPRIRTPDVGRYYSVNESNWNRWSPAVQRVVATFKNGDGAVVAKNARYIGSLVADFHRNLISGGIFLYPADSRSPEGKLRLLYEAAPLAFVVEQAGGAATDGRRRILDISPTTIHQKSPLVIGSRADVEFATGILAAPPVPV